MNGQLHAPAALPPRKDPKYSLDRRLGGLQRRSGRGGEEKIPSPCWESKPGSPARKIVTVLNKLPPLDVGKELQTNYVANKY
jgi:hypothetical protein